MKKSIIIFLSLVFVSFIIIAIASLYTNNKISNQKLRDKVLACGMMFGEDFKMALGAHIDKHLTDNTITDEFKCSVQNIFDMLPEKDRLKSYEDYIACIEKEDL
ncbi:MAG: hypothetical protein HRU35_03210 [Rickettsiaceae bacterium]|nr:hypothetical protein [Rickettsiaceae bacterium]